MDFSPLLTIFNDKNIISLFFKTLAVILSVFYFAYAIVILQQTRVMNKTLETEGNRLFLTISFLQIIVGIILVFLAILLI